MQLPQRNYSWRVQIVNHQPQELTAYLVASSRQGNQRLFEDRTDFLTLKPGLQVLDLSDFAGLSSALTSRSNEEIEPRTFCLELYNVEQELLARSCEEQEPELTLPPYLVYPFHQEVLSPCLPVFSWVPPSPLPQDRSLTYSLRVVEVPPYQNPQTAMRSGPAFFSRDGLANPILPYAVGARAFEKDKQYAWQISAYSGANFLGQSEVWVFGCKESAEIEEENREGPFVELRRGLDGGYYPAIGGKVRIRFDHVYNEYLPSWYNL